MKAILKHVSSTMIAGVVALLPVGGTVLTIVYLESLIAAAWQGIEPLRPHYFPGLGLVAAAAIVYLVGLTFSSFVGKWLWGLVDGLLRRLPLLGPLYGTLKQILGYGEGEEGVFQRVVMVRSREHDAEELGLVTSTLPGDGRVVVFVPGSPTPTTGRLLVLAPGAVRPTSISVHDALTALVSVGKSNVPE